MDINRSGKPVCPPGFDCVFLNSCPNYYVACPDGYFCNSYAGFKGEGEMDYRFAQYVERNGPYDVTQENKEMFCNPYKSIQVKCLFGFFCSSSYEMEACPEGHWCSESTVVPNKCDPLSYCPYNSGFQINFMSTVLAGLMSIFIFTTSYRLVSSQRQKNNMSRKKNPSNASNSNLLSNIVRNVDSADKLTDSHTKMNSVVSCGSGNANVSSNVSAGESNFKHGEHKSLVEVNFRNLTFQVPGDGAGDEIISHQYRDILPRISGVIPAGKFSVILGPTGCGKSTLLNLIRKGGSGATTGRVEIALINNTISSINGEKEVIKERDLVSSELSQYVGYVPQEDILDRELTVRELLVFNARARLPHLAQNAAEIERIVDNVLNDLAIQHVGDSIIGGGENIAANISGGQLKRVNIAVELVALSSPALLLLDEPTAGLDAAIAYDLIESLVDTVMRHKGITILSVLQQPRAEIFNKIDHLFLMDAEGNIVYEGEAADVVPYLISIGFVKPGEDTADADFCIDVLNGLADRVPLVNPQQQQQNNNDSHNSHHHNNAHNAQVNPMYNNNHYNNNNNNGNSNTNKNSQNNNNNSANGNNYTHANRNKLSNNQGLNITHNNASQNGRSTSRSSNFPEEFSLLDAWQQYCNNKRVAHLENNLNTLDQYKVTNGTNVMINSNTISGMFNASSSGTNSPINNNSSNKSNYTNTSTYNNTQYNSGKSHFHYEHQSQKLRHSVDYHVPFSSQYNNNNSNNNSARNSSISAIQSDNLSNNLSTDNDVKYIESVDNTHTNKQSTFEQYKTRFFTFCNSAKQNTLSFLHLARLNAERLLVVRFRNTSSLITYFAINMIMAIALSSGFSILMTDTYLGILSPPTRNNLQEYYPSPIKSYSTMNVNDFSIAQLLFFMSSSLGCASCLSSVPVFAGQIALIKREHSAGLSIVAYAVGRMSADLLFVVFNGMVFTGTWMAFGHPGSYYNWILTILATAFAASSIGYLTSSVAKKNNAAVYAIITTFIFCVFNGTEPTLSDVSEYPVVSWPWYVSFATWTSEATYITWSQYLENDGRVSDPVQEGADHYGYQVESGLGRSIGALIALGISMRIVAVAILYIKANRQ